MANPSYPMHPQMQGMQPMQQPQQGQPPAAQRPVRRGTSRAVPVVVSAGLAVGVFCGLLFGLGTGEEDLAAATPSASTTPDKPTDDEVKPIPSSLGTSPTPPARPAPSMDAGSGSAVAAGAGSGSGSAVAAGAGSSSAAAPAAPAANKVKLTVELKPDAVAASAKITVDKAAITGTSTEIDLGAADKKDVTLVIEAQGWKPVEQKVTLEGDTTVKIELVKKAAAAPVSTPARPRPPRPPKPKPGEGGGSLIDL